MWVDMTGAYSLRYTATDGAGNIAELDMLVVIINGTAPALFLKGTNPLVIEVFSNIVDPGAYVVDSFGWTSVVGTNITDVDTSQLGRQTVAYWVSEANRQGLTASPIYRFVEVRDATPPVCMHIFGVNVTAAL